MRSIDDYLPHVADDLNWVIRSPFLTKDNVQPALWDLPETAEILAHLVKNPDHILPNLEKQKRHNLGTYFETLVFYWLENLSCVEIVASNLQIRTPERTLGELDLLFKYEGDLYHWELSVKFYSLIGDGEDEFQWVGPLKKDTLGRKLNRLYDHQIPLIQTREARALLTTHTDITQGIQSFAFVKGVLYKGSITATLPKRINPNCTVHNWHRAEDITPEKFADFTHYVPLRKLQWMICPSEALWQPLTDVTMICDLVEKNGMPTLFAFATQHPGGIHEVARDFIMPLGWEQDEFFNSV